MNSFTSSQKLQNIVYRSYKKKYFQQYVDSFQITKRVNLLAYRLTISDHWRIHFVFIITQLESMSSSEADFFRRLRFIQFDSVFVENDIFRVKFYEIERLINKKKSTREKKIEYLVRWKKYESEKNVWRNFSKLNNAMKLINEYENSIREIIFLFDRFNRLFQFDLQQSSSEQRFAVIISSKMSSIFSLKQSFASSSLFIDLKQSFSAKFIRKFITDVTIKTSIDASSIAVISRKTNSVQMSSIFNLKQSFVSSSLFIDLKQFFFAKSIRKFITDATIKTSIDASFIVLISRKTNSIQEFAVFKSRQEFAIVISIKKSYIDASFEKKHETKN